VLKSLCCALAALLLGAMPAWAQAPHPLDPLSPAELESAVRIIRADSRYPAGAFFALVERAEPNKEDVRAFRSGQPFAREAFAVVFDRAQSATSEVRVDLREGTVSSWTPRPGVQPMVLFEEYTSAAELVRADPRWQAAMRRRGIEKLDYDSVQIDIWASGLTPPEFAGSRLLRAVSYRREGGINFNARPIEGVAVLLDMTQKQVLSVIDGDPVPIGPAVELDERSLGRRTDLRPLEPVQPAGPSFGVDGWEVSWQKWKFRFAMQPRDGLVLYAVSYADGDVQRPIAYRAALAEMLVPYFDPDANWVWRNAFDEGEYGLGRLASPLEPQRDAPGNAVFFPAHFSDDLGKAYTMEKAIALYERDGGLLWKHYNGESQVGEARRARELVLLSVATIGNYDYALEWRFGQDGSLRFEAGLTGIMLAKGVAATSADQLSGHGSHLVAPNIAAPHHQHFFNLRLDLDIDGSPNSVLESNVKLLPPVEGDPASHIEMEETLLAREGAARRELNPASSRRWSIVHAAKRNALGGAVGFVLQPGANTPPYLHPDSPVRKRAAFIDHQVWVTRYKPEELYAAGAYPNQSTVSAGLPEYGADDESLEGEDIVLWYTLGTTHLPRPEEWPVMPVHRIGFELLPFGFFERNPGLDVPNTAEPAAAVPEPDPVGAAPAASASAPD
jgi:primary-amine oxidase